jgi:hypothetical protein
VHIELTKDKGATAGQGHAPAGPAKDGGWGVFVGRNAV